MCFETRDAGFAAVCKERDELKQEVKRMEKENVVYLDGRRVRLTGERAEQVRKLLAAEPIKLSTLAPGTVFTVGGREMVVLEQCGETTAAITRELAHKQMRFGENNCFADSDVDEACKEFAEALETAYSEDILVTHSVDLTSDDGLKDYGTVDRKASLLTADLYRRFVEILDLHKLDAWWWLATPYSTARHENDRWVKCVAPSGDVDYDYCYRVSDGVRPFCIFKSSIFVSC